MLDLKCPYDNLQFGLSDYYINNGKAYLYFLCGCCQRSFAWRKDTGFIESPVNLYAGQCSFLINIEALYRQYQQTWKQQAYYQRIERERQRNKEQLGNAKHDPNQMIRLSISLPFYLANKLVKETILNHYRTRGDYLTDILDIYYANRDKLKK